MENELEDSSASWLYELDNPKDETKPFQGMIVS